MLFSLLSLWMKSYSVTIQMKTIEQQFPVVLFIVLYKVVLTFKSVDEILKCDHSFESYWAVLSCGAVYYAVQGGSTVLFESVGEILECDHSYESYWKVSFCRTAHNYLTLNKLNFWKFVKFTLDTLGNKKGLK